MPSRSHWNLLEPSPRLPACATCGGRGWCLECEGTGYTSSVPRAVECPCGLGQCVTCGGRGTCAPELAAWACPQCGGEELTAATTLHDEVPDDPLTRYERITLRCERCDLETTIDRRDPDDRWRSPHVPQRRQPYRCPRCASTRVRQGDHAMRCWSCGLDERALADLAAWRDPAHVPIALDTTERELRATRDKALYTDRWPWRPRVRSATRDPVPAWIEEVVQAPDDMYLRLVGADLVEREDPERARFMRDQIEAEPRLAAARTTIEVEAALTQITCRRVASYSPELARLATERVIAARGFARGLVEHVTMSARDFLDHAEDVFARAPIRFLTLTHLEDLATHIAASPWLTRLRALRLPQRESRPTLDPARRSEGAELMAVNAIDDAALSALCESPHLGALEYLDLEGHGAISVITWGRLALAAPHLRWVTGAPRRGEVMTEDAGYELTRWVEPDPTAIAIDMAAGYGGVGIHSQSQVAWLPLDEPFLGTWERIRAVCAHAPVMQRRA